MAQQPCLEVAAAAMGIDQSAVVGAGDRIDRQVAAAQVVLERDLWGEVGDEAAVARPDLAFEPRQRMFLARLRVQEHREIAAHRQEAAGFELRRGRADDDPVALDDLAAEQRVPDGASHEIDLHACMLPEHSRCWPSACRASPAAARPTCCRPRAASGR